MKKAIVHEWFTVSAGAEKCIESITNIWDDFDIFSLVDFFSEEDRQQVLKGKHAQTSFIQNLPFAKKKFRNYFALFPFAVEQFDVSKYDLILSSSHAVAKGVVTRHDQLHVSYVYSPVRYAWDLYHQYLRETNLDKGFKSIPVKWGLHYLRNWDANTANRPDYYIAISHFIAKRIKKIYDKEAMVIYPPVNCSDYQIGNTEGDYYFTSSRMVPYKRMDLIVEAFKYMPDKKLFVSGDGPDYDKIKKIAGKNVELLGFLGKDELVKYTQGAKAFIFASEEDFGITPIEAQACGVPVIALGKGGALETTIGSMYQKNDVKNTDTGVFFDEQTVESIIGAIKVFEANQNKFNKEIIRKNALTFETSVFEKNMKETIDNLMNIHLNK